MQHAGGGIPAHGGNIRRLSRESGFRADEITDFSASINPFGPPARINALICGNLDSIRAYPDPDAGGLISAASKLFQTGEDEIVAGNGSSEIIFNLARLFTGFRAVIPQPAYSDYERACTAAGLEIDKPLLVPENNFQPDFAGLEKLLRAPSLVFLGYPANPTGQLFDSRRLRALAAAYPDCRFVIDEAFADFIPGIDRHYVNRPKNVIVIYSLTKFYSLPGLRIGLAFMDGGLAESYLKIAPGWPVNSLAQVAGEAALTDPEFAAEALPRLETAGRMLKKGLAALPGIITWPTGANFILCRTDNPNIDALKLADVLLKRFGIAIRTCANFTGLDKRCFRVAVRCEEENQRLLDALGQILNAKNRTPRSERITPALMFQGTASNVGKSLLTAALCRIFLQDGLKVAPFKAQNMSLNSFVTKDGFEIGRAQALQARAARLPADPGMNPLLLKPTTDVGSQVILMGKPVGNMSVEEYISFKPRARETVRKAYRELASGVDVMVIEGAGSPAEVNLRAHDLVNMDMAGYAKARVMLVGDIDKGGVFAHFLGTMHCLDKWERDLVKGFVINKFRGRAELLNSGIEFLKSRTGKPVAGIVPYFSLNLPEEDSVSFKSGDKRLSGAPGKDLDIACLDLPYISNFTDFDPLFIEPDVCVRIVKSPADLGDPDAIIIPGSKSVAHDLEYLVSTGLAEAIRQAAAGGRCEVVGICGGLQMLGERISDPAGLEGACTGVRGLGLLSLETVFMEEKTLNRVNGVHRPSGLVISGYEIHHGVSGLTSDEACPIIFKDDGEPVGFAHARLPVWGTYTHGVFDTDGFRAYFLDGLRKRKGLEAYDGVRACFDIEPALDELAQIVRNALDMKYIYSLIS